MAGHGGGSFLPLAVAAVREMSEQPLSGQRAVPARALTAGYRFRLPALAGAPADPPPPRQRAREGDGAGRAPPPLAAG